MFPTSVIRKLARSEEMFAQSQTFFGTTIQLNGPVDIDAMSVAFDTLLQAHPVLAGHLERGPDGAASNRCRRPRSTLVFGWSRARTRARGHRRMRLDQSVSLANLRLKLVDGGAELTLLHPSQPDGRPTQFGASLRSCSPGTRTRCAPAASIRSSPQPAPEPLEVVLEQRGIRKQSRSGFERFMPAMFAYELPPSTRDTAGGNPDLPHTGSGGRRCRLTEPETAGLDRIQSRPQTEPQRRDSGGYPAGRVAGPRHPEHPDSLPLVPSICDFFSHHRWMRRPAPIRWGWPRISLRSGRTRILQIWQATSSRPSGPTCPTA